MHWWSIVCIYITVGARFIRWRWQMWRKRPILVTPKTTLQTDNHLTEDDPSVCLKRHSIMKRTLLIIRHGQTKWNVEHRLPGQLEGIELNETGKQQAARLAEALTVLPISAIISSPLERATATAEFLAHGRNLSVQLEPDLMDTDIGPWAGKV